MREIRYLAISLLTLLIVSSVKAFHDDATASSPKQSQGVVSAKAGGVNLVEGEVSLLRDNAEWRPLVGTDELQTGDIVRTGRQSRAEILLYPGAFLRLSEDTRFSFVDPSLGHLKMRIDGGTAIIEAPAIDDFKGSLGTVVTPQGDISIIRAGIYRFEIKPDGKTTAKVFKGRLAAGSTEVREGQEAALENGTAVVSAFDVKTLDAFDEWSKDRSKTLAALNSTLRKTTLSAAGFGLAGSDLCGGLWWYFSVPFGSAGLTTVGTTGVYTYVPFGPCSPWRSPYGWEYLPWNPAPNGGGSGGGGHHHKHHKPHGTDDQGQTIAAGKPKYKPTTAPAAGGVKAGGAASPKPGKIVISDKPAPTRTPAANPPQRAPETPRNTGTSLSGPAASGSSPGSSTDSSSSGGGHPHGAH